MNEGWSRIQGLFLEALDLPPQDRAHFLDMACVGDAEMRCEVESLLACDGADEKHIADALAHTAQSLIESEEVTGKRFGAWRVLKEIGHGGMGAVYLATRDDDQFQKLVAIKVVKQGMDTEDLLRRFRRERQILANLDHPYIARLMDGGSTPEGRPFLVIDYVEGRPIDIYCSEMRLDVEARCRLFLKVCEAVSYAHRSLVIHRDLKPGNILVTADGSPKLLDFGVAKLLDTESDRELAHTMIAGRLLTPEYASPEQVRGEFVGTASDVYALGALLYELLTGVKAQRVRSHSAAEWERVVCETEVQPPSACIEPANRRLRKRLSGDLDNIVIMAMRKESAHRYSSVDLLAEDIRRHLEARPVTARPISFAYRFGKYARRNLLWLAAWSLVVISMAGGTWAALSAARHARIEQQRAEAQRQLAEQERARAESQKQVAEQQRAHADEQTQVAKTEQDLSQRRLAEMLELADRSLFDVHAAIEKLPGATEARRQIVVTTLKFLEDLSKDAGHDDRLRYELSVSYAKVGSVLGSPLTPNLGDSKGALANYGKAVEMIESLLAKEPDNPRYILQWLEARGDSATVLASTGEERRAVSVLRALLPPAQRLTQLCPNDTRCWLAEATVCGALVDILVKIDLGAALGYAQLQTRSLQRAMRSFPEKTEIQLALATAYSQEARVLNTRGELREAAELFQRAIALRERAIQSNPSDVLTRRSLMVTYANLGGNLGSPVYLNLGNPVGAREYYAKALAIARELAKADGSNQLAQYDLANALLYYSVLDVREEEWAGSLANLQEAHAILQRLVTADPKSVLNLRPLAMVEEYEGRRLESLGNSSEALLQYRQSLATAEKALARNPSDLSLITQALTSAEVLAEALARQGDHTGALAMARNAIGRAEHVAAPESERGRVSRFIANAYQTLATVQAASGNWSEAGVAAARAVTEWRQLIESGSRLADPAKVARAEALLQDCKAHLQ